MLEEESKGKSKEPNYAQYTSDAVTLSRCFLFTSSHARRIYCRTVIAAKYSRCILHAVMYVKGEAYYYFCCHHQSQSVLYTYHGLANAMLCIGVSYH